MTQARQLSWRSLLRYRLRSLLLLATVIAAGLAAWVQWVEKPYERQRAALDAMDVFAARVEFEDRGPGWLPAWAAKRFRRAVSLHLEQLPVCDENMEHVGRLVHLERLYLGGTRITDEGLRHLTGLTGLRRLSLRGTRVTDAGLKHLSGMWRVEALDVQQTECTQTCLQYLAPAKRMETLQFDFDLDDRGVADLARLRDRRDGGLWCRNLSLEGFQTLVRVRGITRLSLRNLSIGREEAEALARMPDLTRLWCSKCEITDPAALRALRSAGSRPSLFFEETDIVAADVLRELASEAQQFNAREHGFVIRSVEPLLRVSVERRDIVYDLTELSWAKELRSLRVERGVNGTGLDFTGLKKLEELVWLSAMSESQARQLGALANLRKLVLRIDPALPPSAFEPLRGLRNVQSLDLALCYLTDEHLAFLGSLAALRELHLASNPLKGGCLAHLRNLPQLQGLSLLECKDFDEANLKHVAAIKSLADVTLQYAPVSDAGLKALHGMPNLRHVSLLGTRVTDQGLAALKAALPAGAEVY